MVVNVFFSLSIFSSILHKMQINIIIMSFDSQWTWLNGCKYFFSLNIFIHIVHDANQYHHFKSHLIPSEHGQRVANKTQMVKPNLTTPNIMVFLNLFYLNLNIVPYQRRLKYFFFQENSSTLTAYDSVKVKNFSRMTNICFFFTSSSIPGGSFLQLQPEAGHFGQLCLWQRQHLTENRHEIPTGTCVCHWNPKINEQSNDQCESQVIEEQATKIATLSRQLDSIEKSGSQDMRDKIKRDGFNKLASSKLR